MPLSAALNGCKPQRVIAWLPLHLKERYQLCSGQKSGTDTAPSQVKERSKMAPSPPPSPSVTVSAQQQATEGEDSIDIADWGSQPFSQPLSQPIVDYKRTEVATRMAPDLQETLETTIQASLLKLQADIHSHTGRLNEMKQRVSCLEDKNTSTCYPLNQILHRWAINWKT